jgi:hypothetical protein
MKTYEVKLEKGKYNIYYYINGEQETKEFYALDLENPISEIRQGYKLKE